MVPFQLAQKDAADAAALLHFGLHHDVQRHGAASLSQAADHEVCLTVGKDVQHLWRYGRVEGGHHRARDVGKSAEVSLMHGWANAATAKRRTGSFVIQRRRHGEALLPAHAGNLLLHRGDGGQAATVPVMVAHMGNGEGVRFLKRLICQASVAGEDSHSVV